MFDWFFPKKKKEMPPVTSAPVEHEEKHRAGDTRITKTEFGDGKVTYIAEVYKINYNEYDFLPIGKHGGDRRFGKWVYTKYPNSSRNWEYDEPEPFEEGTLELAQYRIDKYLEYKRSVSIVSTTYIKYP